MKNKVSIRSIRNANNKMSSHSSTHSKGRNTISLSGLKANTTYKAIKTR